MIPGTEITEGRTRLIVPSEHSVKGPGTIIGKVFFNEQMAFNRDVSVMFLRALDRKMSVADCMTATGSRAVRIANEVPRTEVTANDISRDTQPYIETNIALNSLENCRASNRNLHSLLAEEVFDYVDLDPFGSPVPFLHSAIQGCRRGGILAVTATDTAPLAGAHKAKCLRRYGARPIGGPLCHESGLRILMGTVARELAKFDKGMVPLLSFYSDHYFRTYVKVLDGAGRADGTLQNIVHLSYDPESLERSASSEADTDHKYGPMWGGRLFDKEILAHMDPEGTEKNARCEKSLSLWREELDTVPYLYDSSEISSHLKVSPPRFERLLDALNGNGVATRTHMSPTSFKTDLELRDVLSIYNELATRS